MSIAQATRPLEGRDLPRRDTLAILMALTAISQLGVGLVLPALPIIGQSMGMAVESATLVVSSYLFGLALGQLVTGPLSDRFGRRRMLLLGLLLFLLAGLGAAFAKDAPTLLLMRLVQGAGAGAPLALGLAVARDLFKGSALLRVTTLITMAAAIVPGLAPVLGGVLVESIGWRFVFGFVAAAGGGVLLVIIFRLPETNTLPRASLDLGDVLISYGGLLKNVAFMRNALSNALMLSALYAYLAGAPLMLIGSSELTPFQFGLVAAVTSACYLLGGWVMLRAVEHPARRAWTLAAAWAVAVIGVLALLTFAVADELGSLTTILGAGLFALGLGAVLPEGVAGALASIGKEAGSASALLGALNMAGGALAGAAVGWAGGITAAFPAVMVVCVIGAFLVASPARHA